jgi:hypothetical protein
MIVNMELDRLQNPSSHTRKRAQGVVDSDSTRAQKVVKTTQISVPANTFLQSHLPVTCSMATDDELTSPSKTIKITATNDTEGTFAKATTMKPSNNVELIFSSETTIGMPENDSEWAFAASMMPTNDSGWAFAETTRAMPANDSGWAFAETAPVMPANDSGWAFAETAPTMPTNDGGWTFTQTVG